MSLKQLSKAYQGFLYKFSYALALALSKSLFRDGKVIINNIYVPHGAETKFHSQSWKQIFNNKSSGGRDYGAELSNYTGVDNTKTNLLSSQNSTPTLSSTSDEQNQTEFDFGIKEHGKDLRDTEMNNISMETFPDPPLAFSVPTLRKNNVKEVGAMEHGTLLSNITEVDRDNNSSISLSSESQFVSSPTLTGTNHQNQGQIGAQEPGADVNDSNEDKINQSLSESSLLSSQSGLVASGLSTEKNVQIPDEFEATETGTDIPITTEDDDISIFPTLPSSGQDPKEVVAQEHGTDYNDEISKTPLLTSQISLSSSLTESEKSGENNNVSNVSNELGGKGVEDISGAQSAKLSMAVPPKSSSESVAINVSSEGKALDISNETIERTALQNGKIFNKLTVNVKPPSEAEEEIEESKTDVEENDASNSSLLSSPISIKRYNLTDNGEAEKVADSSVVSSDGVICNIYSY